MIELYAILAALVSACAGAVWLYFTGRRAEKQETALEAAERYAKTRKAMDDAEMVDGNDPDAARRWLHERGQSGGGL